MNISEINRSIIAGSFTNDELTSIGDAIKFARAQLANKNKFTLVKGSKVKFTNSRSGGIVIGTVEKVNRKYIIVREQNPSSMFGTNCRVPASMLSAA